MGEDPGNQLPRGLGAKREPKFCRCRVCHEHFYGDTIGAAQEACRLHAREQHPTWGDSACYCPD